jgi:hypothetical protein
MYRYNMAFTGPLKPSVGPWTDKSYNRPQSILEQNNVLAV